MAEPCQLYLKVKISRSRLEAFLHSEAGSAACYEDLYKWLDERRNWRSEFTWNEACDLGEGTTAATWIDRWSRHSRSPLANHYDDASQTWCLAVLEFTESNDWIIGATNVVRRIAEFKDLPSTDYLLMYEYLFGEGAVVVAVEITEGRSRILNVEPPRALICDADQAMGELLRSMDVTPAE